MRMYDELLKKIEGRNAVVGVVGLGYVGLPLILCFTEKGFKCYRFDVERKKTEALMVSCCVYSRGTVQPCLVTIKMIC